jgi:glutamate racemase
MSITEPLVGLFDSGVGGLSIVRAVCDLIPAQPIFYLADQSHVPYGERKAEEVLHYSRQITRFLQSQGVVLIVIACNTASAVALQALRTEFPDIPFVGMEPAVKPASQHTRSGVVGVLATPTTFQGELFSTLIERFAKDVKVIPHTCPGLVNEIEAGNLKGNKARDILQKAIQPMLDEGADTLVMGCTHYPFIVPLIRQIFGESLEIIDPSAAIAQRVKHLLTENGWLADGYQKGKITIATTGDARALEKKIPLFMGDKYPVIPLQWQHDNIQFLKSSISNQR